MKLLFLFIVILSLVAFSEAIRCEDCDSYCEDLCGHSGTSYGLCMMQCGYICT